MDPTISSSTPSSSQSTAKMQFGKILPLGNMLLKLQESAQGTDGRAMALNWRSMSSSVNLAMEAATGAAPLPVVVVAVLVTAPDDEVAPPPPGAAAVAAKFVLETEEGGGRRFAVYVEVNLLLGALEVEWPNDADVDDSIDVVESAGTIC